MKTQKPGDILRDLQDSFDKIAEERLKELTDLREIQIISRSLLRHEEKRLSRKLGEDHPRTRRMKARIKQNLEIVKDLDSELEIARIKTPEVARDETLIHGRVVDEGYRGVKGLEVCMVDASGNTLANLGTGKADDSGYYSIVVKSENVREMSKVLEEGVFLTVRDRKSEVIHRRSEPVKIAEGDRILAEVVLSREDVATVRDMVKRPPEEIDRAFGPDTWVVWGRVTDEKDQGIGGLTVSVYDKGLTFDDRLGTISTDKEGYFILSYLEEDFQDLIDAQPDIYLKVLDEEGKTLYSSKEAVKYESGRAELFNVQIRESGAKPKRKKEPEGKIEREAEPAEDESAGEKVKDAEEKPEGKRKAED